MFTVTLSNSITPTLHPDTNSWNTVVTSAGGYLTNFELYAHDQWRRDIGDTIASKIKTSHMYWVQDPIAKKVPYFRQWGPSVLTVEGSPSATNKGFLFNGTAGQRIRTSITPSTQVGFNQFDQFFIVHTYGKNISAAVDQAICGARTNSGTRRSGVNWRTTNSTEVYGGVSTDSSNNYSQTDGPYSGFIGLSFISGSPAISYRNGVVKTSTTYISAGVPAAEEWVGGLNGIGATYFSGEVGCWMRGMGLTQNEYVTLNQSTQKLLDTLGNSNTLVARGDSLIAAGSGLTLTSGAIDYNYWYQFSTANYAVGGTNIATIQMNLNIELSAQPNQRDWIGVYSAGRNDFRFNTDISGMKNSILTLLNTSNNRGRYRWFEIPPQSQVNNDEDQGYPFFIRRETLNNEIESIIGQRCVRCIEALRASANITNATDVSDLDRGITPTSLRGDTVHPNAAGQVVMRKMLWESLKNTLKEPTTDPYIVITPLAWISGATGSIATSGQTLKCCPGGWAGNPSWQYQWQKNTIDISGQLNNNYLVSVSDISSSLRCKVTAINQYGTNFNYSNSITIT